MIATGAVISKEDACGYALDTFDADWHPVIDEAMSFLRTEGSRNHFRSGKDQLVAAGEFGLHVIAAANAL